MNNIIEEGSLTNTILRNIKLLALVDYSIVNINLENVWGLLSASASIVAIAFTKHSKSHTNKNVVLIWTEIGLI